MAEQRSCDHQEYDSGDSSVRFNYCPWCGAKLLDQRVEPEDDCQKKGCAD